LHESSASPVRSRSPRRRGRSEQSRQTARSASSERNGRKESSPDADSQKEAKGDAGVATAEKKGTDVNYEVSLDSAGDEEENRVKTRARKSATDRSRSRSKSKRRSVTLRGPQKKRRRRVCPGRSPSRWRPTSPSAPLARKWSGLNRERRPEGKADHSRKRSGRRRRTSELRSCSSDCSGSRPGRRVILRSRRHKRTAKDDKAAAKDGRTASAESRTKNRAASRNRSASQLHSRSHSQRTRPPLPRLRGSSRRRSAPDTAGVSRNARVHASAGTGDRSSQRASHQSLHGNGIARAVNDNHKATPRRKLTRDEGEQLLQEI